MPIGEALRLAQDAELDLVEVAPMARPPVVKLMDYGKFKYESAQKAREARRNQAMTVIKEMRLRLKIDPHDYETKKGHVERFLRSGDKVKITVMFRGREQSRPEMGYRLLQRLAADVAELGVVESNPKQDGRNMVMVIAPHRNAQAAQQGGRRQARGEQRQAEEHQILDLADGHSPQGHAWEGAGRRLEGAVDDGLRQLEKRIQQRQIEQRADDQDELLRFAVAPDIRKDAAGNGHGLQHIRSASPTRSIGGGYPHRRRSAYSNLRDRCRGTAVPYSFRVTAMTCFW